MHNDLGNRKSEGSSTAERIAAVVTRFLRIEAASGFVLLGAVIVAMLWANSPWSDSYHKLLAVTIKTIVIDLTLHELINDGLMAIFFFLVGLEIKRELVSGELKGIRAASLPVAAALGGMIAPALIYYGLQNGTPGEKGWGVPIATDIAFAVGFLSLLGSRVPRSLLVFLLAFAIADDLGAIVVIAVFYTDHLSFVPLILGGCGLIGILLLQRAGVRAAPVYVVIGLLIWLAFYKSGIHPTIAGVMLGFLTPTGAKVSQPASDRNYLSALDRIEDRLHLWVAYGIMPLFAVANAGVAISSSIFDDSVGSSVALSVAVALVIGKPAGIVLASWITTKVGVTRLPSNCNWGHMLGIGVLGGVGFTLALFIATLSFDSPTLLDAAKLGILIGSSAAALFGLGILALVTRKTSETR
ncbi:MAG: Na+/H+ antiporter NhaA [Dehalococcoidia bacterium]|nr:Na+/H+ antiporter NhaA [Dehalococcoidia bacterium]